MRGITVYGVLCITKLEELNSVSIALFYTYVVSKLRLCAPLAGHFQLLTFLHETG